MGLWGLRDPRKLLGPNAPLIREMAFLCLCLMLSTIMPPYERLIIEPLYIRGYRLIYYSIQLKGIDSMLNIYYGVYGEERIKYNREYFMAYLIYLFVIFVSSLGSWSLMF